MANLSDLVSCQHFPSPALYIVAMPIGNAADITLRALHVLNLVDVIAAEDTRKSAPLLLRYGIDRPLMVAHKHNERTAAAHVLKRLNAGERVAYISDAGTPGISDPGAKIVQAVRESGYVVIPIPGCSAIITALSAAEDWANTFTFIGFLPSKSKQRATQLQALVSSPHALCFYEAPHRIEETIAALIQAFGGNRRVLIARELTKLHETLHSCTLDEGLIWLAGQANRKRGEFVLLVEGALREKTAKETSTTEADTLPSQHDTCLSVLLEELTVSATARVAAALTGAPRAQLYSRALLLNRARAIASDNLDKHALRHLSYKSHTG